ncbi:MAG: alpha/beta hydrolase [Alphaproteobacteria bacterium]|nr:alpha/beta hydrolase [Alphaproteobacteria bacterium]
MKESHISVPVHEGQCRMVYYDWASRGNTKLGLVLCLHGLTGNGRFFDKLADALSDAGYRVVCPDMVGRGKSGWLKRPRDYNIRRYFSHLEALVSHLGVRDITLIGTSMGGVLGMMLAAKAVTPLRRLVLNDVGAVIPRGPIKHIRTYVGADPRFADLEEVELYLRTIYAGAGSHETAQWRALAEIASYRLEDGGYRLAFDPAISKPLRWLPPFSLRLWHVWDAIACPVLVLRGAESPILSAKVAETMQKREPKRVDCVELPGIGHAPSLMKPNQIALILDWMEKN